MTYEAFDTLLQTLDRILKHGDDRVITHSVKQEILSIRVQALVLQLNVKHYPNKETIREAAVSTHEIIESLFSEENLSDGESIDPTVRLANRLRELAERLESTVGDVVDYINGKGSVSSLESTVGDVVDCIKGGKDSVSSVTDDFPDVSSSSRSAIRSSKDDKVVGFIEDVEVIKRWLLWGTHTLKVIPIVGRGGIGKTTLAKIVYNHASVMENFDICAWVTISQDHSVEHIVLNLLASMKEISAVRDAEGDVPIESLIRKHLELSRYLIVMDDMWSKKAWDDVKSLFPDACNGSRIIVTTRMQDVADYVSSSYAIHTMSLLDEHQSWNLLKQKVFGYKKIPIELDRYREENCSKLWRTPPFNRGGGRGSI